MDSFYLISFLKFLDSIKKNVVERKTKNKNFHKLKKVKQSHIYTYIDCNAKLENKKKLKKGFLNNSK